MNKFFAKIVGVSLAIAMMIGVGAGVNTIKQAKEINAVAETDTLSFTSDAFTGLGSNNYDSGAERTGSATSTTGGDSYSLGSKYTTINSGWQWKATDGIAYNKTAFPGRITNIAVTQSTTRAFTVRGGTSVCNTSSSGTQIGTSKSTASMSWDVDSDKNYTYFVICRGSNAAKVTGITITFETSGGQQGPTALANPNPQYNDSTKQVSWTRDANASKYQVKVDSEANFVDIYDETYDASSLTTGVQHTVYIKAVGDETNYSSTTGSVQFTPTAPFVSKNYALCTSINDLEVGAKYIFTNGISGDVKTMSTESNNNNRKITTVSVDANTHRIASTQQTLVVELGGSEDQWTFKTTNYLGTDGYFASGTGDNNHLRVGASAGTALVSFDNNAVIVAVGPHASRNVLKYNTNSTLFSCYASDYTTNVGSVYLWKEYKVLSRLNITGTPTKLSGYYESEAFDPTGITAYEVEYEDSSTKALTASDIKWPDLVANMGTIKGSYTEFGQKVYTPEYNISVSPDAVTDISLSGTMGASYFLTDSWNQGSLAATAIYATGKQNVVTNDATFTYYSDSTLTNQVATPADLGAGENQTIYVKATYQGVSNTTGYAQTVTVEVEHGSESNDPLTADEAITIGQALASSGTTTKYYYIQGMVASITTNQLNQSGENQYATFTYDDNNGSASFKAYRIKPNAGCTDFTDFKVGAVVLIRCKIYKHASSVIENDETGEILSISFTAAPLQQIDVDKDNLELGKGDTYTLKATPKPLNAEMDDLIWRSDDTSVATVSSNGIVRGVGEGETRVYAISHGIGSTVCRVKVYLTASLNLAINSTKTTSHESMQWEVANKFEMELAKGESAYNADNHYPDAAHDYTETRFYNKQVLSFTGDSTLNIRKVELRAKESSDIAGLTQSESLTNATVSSDYLDVILRPVDGTSPFSILVKNACSFTSVKVYYNCSTNFEDYKAKSSSFSVISGDEDAEHNASNIKLNFGVRIRQCDWSSMNSGLGEITDYGVMFVKKSTLNGYPKHTIAESFEQHSVLAVVNKGSGATPLADGNDYVFSAYINITTTDHYNIVYVAAPFIVAGGNYFFFNEMEHSVRSMAAACFDQGGSNLSEEALYNLI